jgi:phosphatidylserine decarboxylase
MLFAALTIWCICFFRDPERFTPTREGLIIAPADGIIQLIDSAPPPPELNMGAAPLLRVCIFMNVFNVHVNRAPCDGTITNMAYWPGQFLNASLDKSSELNERQSLRIKMKDGREIACVQIAGLIARRIVCWVKKEQALCAGQRFGMIRFGSRVDVYFPDGVAPMVALGQKAVAGETVLADLMRNEPARLGEMR